MKKSILVVCFSLFSMFCFVTNIVSQDIKCEISFLAKGPCFANGIMAYPDGSYDVAGGFPFPMTTIYTVGFQKESEKNKVKYPFKDVNSSTVFEVAGKNYCVFIERNKTSKLFIPHLIQFGPKATIVKDDILEPISFDTNPKKLVIKFSKDSSKVAVFFELDDDDKKDPFSVQALVFDQTMKILNQSTVSDKKEKSQKLNSFEAGGVDNDGSLYILQKTYKNKDNNSVKVGKKSLPNYTFTLNQKSLKKESNVKLEIGNEFIYNSQLIFDHTDRPVILQSIGADDTQDPVIIGFMMHKIDTESSLSDLKKHIFSDEELDDFGVWEENEIDGLSVTSKIQANYILQGENIVFFYEKIYMTSQVAMRGNGKQSQEQYLFAGPIACFTINNDGQVLDYTYIPKCASLSRHECSLMIPYKDGVGFIYLDKESNMDYDISNYAKIGGQGKMRLRNGQHLVFAHKNASGTIVRKSLGYGGTCDVDFDNSKKIGPNTYLIGVSYFKSSINQKVGLFKVTIN